MQGRMLLVNAKGNAKVKVMSLNGSEIATATLNAGNAAINLEQVQSGIYMVKVDGLGAKKIAIK